MPAEPLTPEGETWRCPGCRDTTAPMGMCQKCGVFGLRYVTATRAAHTPSAGEGLDVERVKQAVTNVAARHGVVKDPPPPSWSLMHFYGYSTTPAAMDAEIAAEYAALSPAPSPTETPE